MSPTSSLTSKRSEETATRMRQASILATAVWLFNATAACSTSGVAAPSDASHGVEVDASPESGKREGGNDATDTGACQGDACLPPPDGVLVSGQQTPIGIALDDDNVYWMNLGTYSAQTGNYSGAQLMKCAKAGCGNAPTVLASGPWNGSTRLAVSGGNVYWATQNMVLSCATDGCTSGPTVLWAGHLAPTDIAVGATAIYFGDTTNDDLLTCPVDGCGANPTVLWSSTVPPAPIALDGATVYFATSGISLLSCGTGGCSPILIGGTPTAMAIGDANVYIGTRGAGAPGAIASCPEATCPTGLTIVTSNLSNCVGLAVDATNVYFTDQGMAYPEGGTGGAGSVSKCPIAGCNDQPSPLAGFVNFPQQIAVDATNAYWTDFGSSTDPHASDDGRVMAVPK
jgi:hypothetical protein